MIWKNHHLSSHFPGAKIPRLQFKITRFGTLTPIRNKLKRDYQISKHHLISQKENEITDYIQSFRVTKPSPEAIHQKLSNSIYRNVLTNSQTTDENSYWEKLLLNSLEGLKQILPIFQKKLQEKWKHWWLWQNRNPGSHYPELNQNIGKYATAM